VKLHGHKATNRDEKITPLEISRELMHLIKGQVSKTEVKCSKFPFLCNNVGAPVRGTDYSEENCKGVLLNITSVPDITNGGCPIDVQTPHLIGSRSRNWGVPGEGRKSVTLRSWNDSSFRYNVTDTVNK